LSKFHADQLVHAFVMCEAPHWEGKNSAIAWLAKESIENLNETNA